MCSGSSTVSQRPHSTDVGATDHWPAREVLEVGTQPTPEPGLGEVRVRLKTSGVNPSDWKLLFGAPIEPDDAVLLCVHFQPKSERREESTAICQKDT